MSVVPEPYGGMARKRTGTGLWDRVAQRSRIIFSVDSTPFERDLIFEALLKASEEIEALRSELAIERAHRLATRDDDPDPDYACGAAYCDDPACNTHSHRPDMVRKRENA